MLEECWKETKLQEKIDTGFRKSKQCLFLQPVSSSNILLYGCNKRKQTGFTSLFRHHFWKVQTYTLVENAKNKYESNL